MKLVVSVLVALSAVTSLTDSNEVKQEEILVTITSGNFTGVFDR